MGNIKIEGKFPDDFTFNLKIISKSFILGGIIEKGNNKDNKNDNDHWDLE